MTSTTDKTKQLAKDLVITEYPDDEMYLFDAIPIEAWNKYKEMIDSYKSGQFCDVGWYAIIRLSLVNLGIEERVAHILADIRNLM